MLTSDLAYAPNICWVECRRQILAYGPLNRLRQFGITIWNSHTEYIRPCVFICCPKDQNGVISWTKSCKFFSCELQTKAITLFIDQIRQREFLWLSSDCLNRGNVNPGLLLKWWEGVFFNYPVDSVRWYCGIIWILGLYLNIKWSCIGIGSTIYYDRIICKGEEIRKGRSIFLFSRYIKNWFIIYICNWESNFSCLVCYRFNLRLCLNNRRMIFIN